MCYTHMTIQAIHKSERIEYWFVFETPHPTFPAQMTELVDAGGLAGIRHDTVVLRDAEGRNRGRQIVNSYPFYVGKSAVMTASEFNVPLHDAAGEKLV